MVKYVGIACAMAFFLFPVKTQNERFSKYKRIEAYEVRPGILMLPRYSANGQVCMIVLQKELYDRGGVDLDPSLSRESLDQIFDELAPPSERGALTIDKELARLYLYSGGAASSVLPYQNVSIEIARATSSPGDTIAVIRWKGCSCE